MKIHSGKLYKLVSHELEWAVCKKKNGSKKCNFRDNSKLKLRVLIDVKGKKRPCNEFIIIKKKKGAKQDMLMKIELCQGYPYSSDNHLQLSISKIKIPKIRKN